MLLITYVTVASVSVLGLFLCLFNAAKGKQALFGCFAIDLIMVIFCVGAAGSTWGYLCLLGDPMPREIVPVLMGFVFLCSAAMAPFALSLAVVHLKYVILEMWHGGGTGGGGAGETPESGKRFISDQNRDLTRKNRRVVNRPPFSYSDPLPFLKPLVTLAEHFVCPV